jgi:perosamine synthetase
VIRLFQPNVGWREAWAVARQVRSGWIGPGKKVRQFEQEFADAVGRKHALAVTSGTTGLLLSLWASNLKSGGTVVFPAYTFLAGANAAKLAGYGVELCDVAEDGCLDLSPFRRSVLPGVVMFVGHNGQGSALTARQWCDSRECLCIEDACQSLGCPEAGSHGHMAVFSFSPQKLITTGQGGMVVTDDDELYDRLDAFRDHGGADWRSSNWHRRVGGNFRMTDIQAAMGLTQLRRLPKLVKRRRRILDWYVYHGLSSIPAWNTDAWCAAYRTRRPGDVIEALQRCGVDARKLYRAVHQHGPYAAEDRLFPVATKLAHELIYLPSHLSVTRQEVKRICELVRQFEGA